MSVNQVPDTPPNFLQLKTYEELVRIEMDVRPPIVQDERTTPESYLQRGIQDVFGIATGYFIFFLCANLLRSAITHTQLYPMYWSLFGPYYYMTKAPILTMEWNEEAEMLSDVEGNQCLASARDTHKQCREDGGSIFKCGAQKASSNANCFLYRKCSDSNIEQLINFYISYKPRHGVTLIHNALHTLRFIDPIAGLADVILNDIIPDEFEPRTGSSRLNTAQINQLHSTDCLAYLQALCLQPTGPLGLRARGISYTDVDDYFKKFCKDLH